MHPYGWLSLVPSLVAIVLAIATRRVIFSLLTAVFVGALITNRWNPFAAIGDTFEIHLWRTFATDSRLRVYAFTILMGAMIGIIHRSGGMTGLVNIVAKWANNRRRGQLATWFLGLLVFFDDYANTVLLGKTLQPLSDRLSISREKLAFIVDSTAAPVAGLALISTWVAGEIEYVNSGLQVISQAEQVNAFNVFVGSIPYRFYVLWALVFVFLVGMMKRDFGPMRTAELRCVRGATDSPTSGLEDDDAPLASSGWWNAVIPVVTTVIGVLWLLMITGRSATGLANVRFADLTFENYRDIFGNADSYYSLIWGTMFGLVTSVILSWTQRLLSWEEIGEAAGHGAKLMLPAIAVLWLASSVSAMTGSEKLDNVSKEVNTYRLSTGEYLASLIQSEDTDDGALVLKALPTIIFVLSAGISFATGTSWGTMAIVMPIAISLVYPLMPDDPLWHQNPITSCTIGSVLAGSIFGDHCSPISDTTVLSSQACGCEHGAHVWTQLPYAMVVGIVTIVFGTLPIGFGVPVQILLPTGVLVLAVFLFFVGKPIPDPEK